MRKQIISNKAMFLVLLFALSIMILPVSAQVPEPTATPSDPAWLGFVAAREAIEEQENTDLSLVAKWEFFQADWSQPYSGHPQNANGIDSCVAEISIVDARPLYYGVTYLITDLRGKLFEVRVSFDLKQVVLCDEPTSAGAGGTTASTDGTLPPPVAGGGVTGGFVLGGHVDGMGSDAVAKMKSAGMTWVKRQVLLAYGIEGAKGMISEAHEKGFKILLGVVGDKNALGTNFDAHAAEFNTFVAALAAAGADAIEVWNEPNIDREWPAGQVNGANYTKLLAGAYNAIKAANPNTMVISGAPAPTGYFGTAGCTDQGCNDDTFMQQMAAAGANQYMDCVGLHYNEGIVAPSATTGDKRGSYPSYFFGSMLNRGYAPFGGTPVCWTELGFLSADGMNAPIPASFGWADEVTVAQQAAWLAEAASLSAQSGKVKLMIIWNVNFTRWDSDPMGGYAIIRPDGSCPACSTLGQVMTPQ
ncbi:hypothetical protein MASR2M15_09310 [Anaerolineales bacterium]